MMDYSDKETSVNVGLATVGSAPVQILGPNVHRIGLILTCVTAGGKAFFGFTSAEAIAGAICVANNGGPFQAMLSQFGKCIQGELWVSGTNGLQAAAVEVMCLCGIRYDPFKAPPPIPGTLGGTGKGLPYGSVDQSAE